MTQVFEFPQGAVFMHFPVLAHVASLIFLPSLPAPLPNLTDAAHIAANRSAMVSPHAMVLLLIAWQVLVLGFVILTAKISFRRAR
jgi:hypothetical protein